MANFEIGKIANVSSESRPPNQMWKGKANFHLKECLSVQFFPHLLSFPDSDEILMRLEV
jgi:hypothetical protein